MPYLDNAIEIARRSMESKALLKSTKMMVAIRLDTQHMSSIQRKATVCSTVDRPAQKTTLDSQQLWLDDVTHASKKKFVC